MNISSIPPIPILLLNWNGATDTIECIPTILKQTYTNFHIYLVDNGSKAEDVALLKQHFGQHPKISLIFNQENLGFTKGNNELMRWLIEKEHPPKYIALLNNDTIVDKDWLYFLVKNAEEQGTAIVSSKMINYFQRHQMDNAGHKMLNTGEILPIGHAEPIGAYQQAFSNIGSCAGATLYATAMLKDIGIFDEYFNTGYEDAELGVRAFVTGYSTNFEPQAIVYHKVSQSVNKIRDYEYTLKIQMDIFYTYLKLMPASVLIINFIPFVIKIGAVLLIDVVFQRWKFLKVMLNALYKVVWQDRQMILKSRRAFLGKHQLISPFKILKKQEFFLLFDIKRFKKYIIQGEDMVFEKW